MTDVEIGNAVRRLPRVTASPRFKPDVLRAVRDRRRPRPFWRLAAVMAMTVVILASMYATAIVHRQRRLESLRTEHDRIEADLRRVKALADKSKPVVVLENGDTRLIVNRENSKPNHELFYY